MAIRLTEPGSIRASSFISRHVRRALLGAALMSVPLGIVFPEQALAQSNTATATDIAQPDSYACAQSGFVGFETLADGTTLPGTIAGLQFVTTGGHTWLVGDFATNNYNGKYPNGAYMSEGTHWAWLGPNQGSGEIDFANGAASYFSLLTSVGSTDVYLEAYDSSHTVLATAGPARYDIFTGHMTELKITRAIPDMAYVIVHDTGNFFLVDSLCTDAPGVTEHGITNAFGNVIEGQPNVTGSWPLGGFDTVTSGTPGPTSCYQSPGCQRDNWIATINWGDNSANSTSPILCLLPPPPGPSPTPPQPVTMHCTIQGTHTYSSRGSYVIVIKFNNAPSTISAESEITYSPKVGDIKASVGELVAYDNLSTNSTFLPCTATAILSATQDMIVTAAHCVAAFLNGGDGHIFAHFKFAPGHSGPTCEALENCGTNPYGVFQADASSVSVTPNVGSEQRLDWAFIHLQPLGGTKVDQVVPALAVEFDGSTDSSWQAVGYPYGKQVGPPGQYQLFYRTCTGDSTTYDAGPPPPGPLQLIISSCANSGLTEGSSGGPWLTSAGAVGTVNKAIGGAGLLGTYLGSDAQAAYLSASVG